MLHFDGGVVLSHNYYKRHKEKEAERETETGTKRDRKGKREKASKGIRNDAKVEHTSLLVADRIGISGVRKNYSPCCPNIFVQAKSLEHPRK